ncbi:MAG: hypothetical protein QOJ09_584 [Actinomycetota bacterium]|jgi:hypothetical protein|nr:hypothetical protein [Actinomycetota bacterium]
MTQMVITDRDGRIEELLQIRLLRHLTAEEHAEYRRLATMRRLMRGGVELRAK